MIIVIIQFNETVNSRWLEAHYTVGELCFLSMKNTHPLSRRPAVSWPSGSQTLASVFPQPLLAPFRSHRQWWSWTCAFGHRQKPPRPSCCWTICTACRPGRLLCKGIWMLAWCVELRWKLTEKARGPRRDQTRPWPGAAGTIKIKKIISILVQSLLF